LWDWLPARELLPGDLCLSHDGQLIAVEEVYDTGEYETVYNLSVADWHTYFVGDENWGFDVWAHNAKCTKIETDSSSGKPQTTVYVKQKFSTEKGPGGLNGRQLRRFVAAWNQQIGKLGGSLKRRTPSAEENEASAIWKAQERAKDPKRFPPKSAGPAYRIVGHTPDAGAGGPSAPGTKGGKHIRAMALTEDVNQYLAGILTGLPMGKKYHRVVLVKELPK
jgi:hypothetical protein